MKNEIHERCIKCGAINGPFERLGRGICNECLQRSVAATKAANKRRAKREAQSQRVSRKAVQS